MPIDSQENESDKSSNNPTDSSPAGSGDINPSNSSQDHVRGNKSTTTKHKEKENTIIINVAHPEINNTEAIEANRISSIFPR